MAQKIQLDVPISGYSVGKVPARSIHESYLNIPTKSKKTKKRYRKPGVAGGSRAENAMSAVLEVLSGISFDCGLDTIEVISLLRKASIRQAAKRQTGVTKRLSISRISVVTGISRREISRQLKSGSGPNSLGIPHESLVSRIMRAWHSDPKFSQLGRAQALKLYGRGATFESLVRLYGRGLPIRAVLDELVLREAIETVSGQFITPRKSLATPARSIQKELETLGERLRHVMRTDSTDRRVRKIEKIPQQTRRNFKRV
jgi:hypothetical protein